MKNKLEVQFVEEVLENFPALIFRVNQYKRVDYYNKTFMDFMGDHIAEEINDIIKNKVFFEEYKKVNEIFKDLFVLCNPFEIESRLENKYGEYRWMLINGKPIYTVEKKFCGYMVVAYDINNYKE
ncbi:MAG: PAS domain S-box protein, partial [Clostridiaceae bacterium]